MRPERLAIRGPELIESKSLEVSDSWLLEDGEREDDGHGKVEDASEPPALVCVVHPHTGEVRLELHVTPSPRIIQVGGGQHNLPSSGFRYQKCKFVFSSNFQIDKQEVESEV